MLDSNNFDVKNDSPDPPQKKILKTWWKKPQQTFDKRFKI